MKIIFSLFFILILNCITANGQQWLLNGNPLSGSEWLGTDGTASFPLELKTIETGANALPINFYTNGGQRMTILGNNGATNGFIGIGIAAPLFRLDLNDDININSNTSNPSNSGYRINGVAVFQVPLNYNKNIFIGPHVGTGMTLGGNPENVFVGQDIAYQQTATGPYTPGVGDFNVCVGTGVAIGMSDYCVNNVFIGWRSAYSNVGSGGCVYIGRESGYSDIGSDVNVFVGLKSGYSTVNAGANTFIGAYSGYSNVNGGGNTLIGSGADVTSANLTNAAAIGFNAKVNADNSLVLGNGEVKVGIGTSSPAYTLDVKGTVAADKIIIVSNDETQDLILVIASLQKQVTDLENKLSLLEQAVVAKN